MKIFILEDNLERIEFFRRVYKTHELTICSDIEYAKIFARNSEFDIFFLDHDLSPNNLEGIDKGTTGYDFVKWLVETNIHQKSVYYIHSMNPTGANAMLNLLQTCGYEVQWIPFHLLKHPDRNET